MSTMTGQVLIARDGWDALDQRHFDEMDEQQKEAFLTACDLFRKCFEDSDAGRRVLEILVDEYLVLERIAQPEDEGNMLQIGIRQGHADVAIRILSHIATAKSAGRFKF